MSRSLAQHPPLRGLTGHLRAVFRLVRGAFFALVRNLVPLGPRADRIQLLTAALGRAVAISGELARIEHRRGMQDAPRDPARMRRLVQLHTEGRGHLCILLDGRRLNDEEVDSLVWALWQRLRPLAAGADLLDLVEDIMEFLGELPGDERMLARSLAGPAPIAGDTDTLDREA